MRQQQVSFYEPNDVLRFQVISDVLGGICTLDLAYDLEALAEGFGVDWIESLESESPLRAVTTVTLDTEIVMTAPDEPSGGGGGFGGFD